MRQHRAGSLRRYSQHSWWAWSSFAYQSLPRRFRMGWNESGQSPAYSEIIVTAYSRPHDRPVSPPLAYSSVALRLSLGGKPIHDHTSFMSWLPRNCAADVRGWTRSRFSKNLPKHRPCAFFRSQVSV